MLELYSYALHNCTVTIETLVLRWAFCAGFSETVGDACALSCVFRSTRFGMCCELLQQHSQELYCELVLSSDGCVRYSVWFGAALMSLGGKVEHYRSGKTNSIL